MKFRGRDRSEVFVKRESDHTLVGFDDCRAIFIL